MTRIHYKSIVAISALSVLASLNASAATYELLFPRTNNQWLTATNYTTVDGTTTGTIVPTANDTFIFNAGTDNINVQANGTIGKLIVGNGYAPSNFNVGTNATTVLTIQSGGAGVTNPGIEIQSGKTTNTNINARLNLQGDITIANYGNSRLRLGAGGGNGGIEGTGSLNIIGGVVLLEQPTAAHTYEGAVTVSSSGSLQVSGGATFNTYSSLIVTSSSGGLVGGGTVAGATINGGRISPGGTGGVDAGVNTLTFTNLLTLQANALLVLDIKAAGSDAIALTGDGSVILGGELRLRLNSDYTDPAGGIYQLISGLDASSGNFNLVNIRTDTIQASSINLTDDGTGIWTGEFNSRSVAFNANTGQLELGAIPEPSHILLSSIGILMLFRRRR